MSKLTTAQLTKATQMFLAEHPEALGPVMAHTQAEAEIMGMSLDELRRATAMEEMAKFAIANGRDPMEMRFSYGASSLEEYERLLREHRAEIQRAIGL